LYCGFVRERGTLRTSTTSAICGPLSKSTNSVTGRVECPMVKKGWAIRLAVHVTAHQRTRLAIAQDDAI
jgi:hypothetical protein